MYPRPVVTCMIPCSMQSRACARGATTSEIFPGVLKHQLLTSKRFYSMNATPPYEPVRRLKACECRESETHN